VKLVDLNQTIFIPIVDESKGGVTYEMKMSVGEFFWKFCKGFEPEVVEAIPVKWLKNKTKHPDNYTRASAKWMLGCWKREQD
jgi:hypothetical protein